ncbi:MAG: phosphate acyltransferase [Lachnospiraceae bacterium]|nr:phosphate acyltransferase [Lachnospiraceae bacterium]
MIKLAVDLKGADRPQEELLPGVFRILSEDPELFCYLLGDREVVEGFFAENPLPEGRYEIVDSPDAVTNHDNPVDAIRKKPDSSLMKGIALCKSDPSISCFVSCGPTGALFVSAIMVLGRIPHVTPVLLCEVIRDDGVRLCISDCGANIDCPEDKLVTFARMGKVYMQSRGAENPRIALLSNGSEDSKGNELVKKANKLLREQPGLNFVGNLEGTDVLRSDADVLVCEGFAGNILLKTIEGAAKSAVAHAVKAAEKLPEPARTEMLQSLREVYLNYDYNSSGGAVLLGANTPVVKGHGSADADTLTAILRIAAEIGKKDLNARIREEFA